MRTTFIKFGSRAYSRSNHCGPSCSGATAVIRGFTRIAPLHTSSIALRIFAGRCARPLQTNLPGHNFLKWQRDLRRNISHQHDASTLTNAIDRSVHSRVVAHSFDGEINPKSIGELKYLRT